jgi:hypothetical protein
MVSERAAVVLLVAQILAVAALAQEAPTATSEFGSASGGQIDLLIKRPSRLSGSLGMRFSQSQFPFASGGSKGYEATFGGTLAEDRLWFFGSVLRDDALPFASTPRALSTPAASSTELGKVNARIGDRNSLAALFAAGTTPTALSIGEQAPSSFLSLHYTGIVTSNMFFTASVVRSSIGNSQSSNVMLAPSH